MKPTLKKSSQHLFLRFLIVKKFNFKIKNLILLKLLTLNKLSMKINKLSLLLIAIAFMAASCGNKCVDCSNCPDDVTLTDSNDNEVASLEVCEDDFDSKEEYDDAIAVTEAFGCECK